MAVYLWGKVEHYSLLQPLVHCCNTVAGFLNEVPEGFVTKFTWLVETVSNSVSFAWFDGVRFPFSFFGSVFCAVTALSVLIFKQPFQNFIPTTFPCVRRCRFVTNGDDPRMTLAGDLCGIITSISV